MLMYLATKQYSDSDLKACWAAFLPSILPVMLLMVGVLVAQEIQPENGEPKRASLFILLLTAFLSVVYLGFLAYPILELPLKNSVLSQSMASTGLILGPFQGLVSLTIGVFFSRNEL
ncbi:MAG: hypothetical protein QM783_02755 [Phycisphaerales bacterium]